MTRNFQKKIDFNQFHAIFGFLAKKCEDKPPIMHELLVKLSASLLIKISRDYNELLINCKKFIEDVMALIDQGSDKEDKFKKDKEDLEKSINT